MIDSPDISRQACRDRIIEAMARERSRHRTRVMAHCVCGWDPPDPDGHKTNQFRDHVESAVLDAAFAVKALVVVPTFDLLADSISEMYGSGLAELDLPAHVALVTTHVGWMNSADALFTRREAEVGAAVPVFTVDSIEPA